MGYVCPKCGAQLGIVPVRSCRCGAVFSNYKSETQWNTLGCGVFVFSVVGGILAVEVFHQQNALGGCGIGIVVGLVVMVPILRRWK